MAMNPLFAISTDGSDFEVRCEGDLGLVIVTNNADDAQILFGKIGDGPRHADCERYPVRDAVTLIGRGQIRFVRKTCAARTALPRCCKKDVAESLYYTQLKVLMEAGRRYRSGGDADIDGYPLAAAGQ
jgi:hypothetical protein